MMNEMNLADVLENYAVVTGAENDQRILHEWMGKYPQYAAALMDFAAARAFVRYAPDVELSAEEEMRYQAIGLQNLRLVLGENPASQATLQSLTEAAKAKGLNKKGFAAAIGLSVSLVQYLEKRRLDFASIPQAVISKVAQILETGEETISAYLNQPPDYAAQASFKTNTRAEEMPPKNFAEAVSEDQTLTPEEKRHLLEA